MVATGLLSCLMKSTVWENTLQGTIPGGPVQDLGTRPSVTNDLWFPPATNPLGEINPGHLCCRLLWEQGVSEELEVLDADLIPEHPPRPGRLLAVQEDQALLSASVWLDPSCLYFSPFRV